MAIERRVALGLCLLALAATACARRAPMGPQGYLVTYAMRPLTTNFHQTPVVNEKDNAGSVFELQYRGFRLQWGDNSIGGLAQEAGFDEVYYADLRTFSIWNVFTMQRVRVYGHKKGAP